MHYQSVNTVHNTHLFPAGGALLRVASGRRSERAATVAARDAADTCMVRVEYVEVGEQPLDLRERVHVKRCAKASGTLSFLAQACRASTPGVTWRRK